MLGAVLALGLVTWGVGAVSPVPPAAAGTDDVAATRAEVRQIQKHLDALGYDAGPVDGQYGQTTRKAIMAFERDHDMPVIGMPDQDVRQRLAKALQRKRAEDTAREEAEADQQDGQNRQTETAQGDDQQTGDTEIALPGTRWRLHHPQGENIVLEFRRGGTIQAPAGSWRWERQDGRVVIHYDSGSRLNSRLIGKLRGPRHMTGWGQDTFGERWQWSADRLPDNNDS